jgi:hypothetical protein
MSVEPWLNILESFTPLAEAAAGYRAELERQGFSPTIAEVMAADFHRTMLTNMMAQAVKS